MSGLLFLSSAVSAYAIDVYVGNNPVKMDVAPVIIGGRTLVPLAAISQSLKGEANWDPGTKTVTINRGNSTIKLQLGNKNALVNNKNIKLDVPAQAISGRTMVPVGFIAQAFGEKVEWNSATKTVLINSDIDLSLPSVTKVKVKRVVDGDTIKVMYQGKEESVRLIGVDTPESVHPDASKNTEFGKISSEFTKKYLDGKEVSLEFDVQERDKYSRLLAYVYIGGEMYNKILLQEGMAKVATFPPNVKYVDDFLALERKAREDNKGLWAYSNNSSSSAQTDNKSNSSGQSNTSGVNNQATQTTDSSKDGTWIKGNINSKIYHVPSGRDYDKLSAKNIVWFKTEKEAEEAGYRKAKQ